MLVQFEDFLQFFGREVLIEGNVLTFAVLEDTVGDGTAAGASVQLGVCPDFVSQIFRKLRDVVTDAAEVRILEVFMLFFKSLSRILRHQDCRSLRFGMDVHE